MAHVNKGSHGFTCTHMLRASSSGMNHTCLHYMIISETGFQWAGCSYPTTSVKIRYWPTIPRVYYSNGQLFRRVRDRVRDRVRSVMVGSIRFRVIRVRAWLELQYPKKIVGKNAKFAQNLREKCAENARKLRAICTSCAQIELKNPLKIGEKNGRKLHVNVLWLRREVFHGFV